ncbi:MAG: hydrogenase maturation protease [Terracidiphilus sp.]|jgi:hydrogenase maturation protease
MTLTQARCLILACGNTLRGDDGVGLWLAEWAERRFADQPGVRVLASFQWTPDLAEDVARAGSVLFIDCSVDSAPGSIKLTPVEPAPPGHGHSTHQLDAAELLALARNFYNSLPREAQLLTIGAGSTELGEGFSAPVKAALPRAGGILEKAVLRFIGN